LGRHARGRSQFGKQHHQQHYAIQPADRAGRDEVLLRQYRTGCARGRAPQRRQQDAIGVPA
jgi:hypothetical protein